MTKKQQRMKQLEVRKETINTLIAAFGDANGKLAKELKEVYKQMEELNEEEEKMIDRLRSFVFEAREFDLGAFIESSYEVICQDANLSTIYEELTNGFENYEMRQRIIDIFGYYGPGVVLKVNDVYYWLMQV